MAAPLLLLDRGGQWPVTTNQSFVGLLLWSTRYQVPHTADVGMSAVKIRTLEYSEGIFFSCHSCRCGLRIVCEPSTACSR